MIKALTGPLGVGGIQYSHNIQTHKGKNRKRHAETSGNSETAEHEAAREEQKLKQDNNENDKQRPQAGSKDKKSLKKDKLLSDLL